MNSTKILLVTVFTVLAGAIALTAAPVNFNEVSLWVRARETDQSIGREVSQRKLARALTPQQESTLKAQGASDSLVQSLRNPKVISTQTDAPTSEAKSQPFRAPQDQDASSDLKDDSYMIGDYISVSSHSTWRAMSIDKRNPEFIKGVPYTLYPIYGVRGASLYFIGSSSNSVKLAVRTSGQ